MEDSGSIYKGKHGGNVIAIEEMSGGKKKEDINRGRF